MTLRKGIFAFVLVCACCLGASPAPAGQTPMERVREGADKIIKMLSDPTVADPAGHDAAVQELRTTAEAYIDFRLTTMYAVGKPWLKMSPALQDQITEAFIKLLERTYLKRIPTYGGQAVHYVKEDIEGKKAKVVTEVADKDKKIIVEFRLRLVNETWMIYDVVAEGVSLVANYRSQFSEVLNQGSGKDLLDLINKRIQQLDEQGDQGDDNATAPTKG